MPIDGAQRWLLLVHQLPSKPSNLRVKTWRRLQSVGAVLVKNSVYVLPNTTEAVEDVEWIRGEILAQGGEATVFAADAIDDLSTGEIIEAFGTARQEDWNELLERVTDLSDKLGSAGASPRVDAERELAALRNRAGQIDKIDYFGARGRQEALKALDAVALQLAPEEAGDSPDLSSYSTDDYLARRWVTRPRPGVDRMASAWLIVRFIDAEAEFSFSDEAPEDDGALPFDMFGVEFGHHGNRCTFETLVTMFRLDEPPLARIARIVHDLDLRADSATDSETATIGRLVYGLRASFDDDGELLDRGMAVFEALYQSFSSESSPG